MTLDLQVPQTEQLFKPRLCVFGVGGAGGNAVARMADLGMEGVELIVANTDAQALMSSKVTNRLQLGPSITQGLGAGGDPAIGRKAAEEVKEIISERIQGTNMVFVAAGLGGGTGSGAAPIIAQCAKEQNILTVGIVTTPFQFEGVLIQQRARESLEILEPLVDTLITVSNHNLFTVHGNVHIGEAFALADGILVYGVRSITDLMVRPGHINLDFADIQSVMRSMGRARIGSGEARGKDRAITAAKSAVTNPLLEDDNISDARDVLINITCSVNADLNEVNDAIQYVRGMVRDDANIVFGLSIDQHLQEDMRVSVLIAGMDKKKHPNAHPHDVGQHAPHTQETLVSPARSRHESTHDSPDRGQGNGWWQAFWRWFVYGKGAGFEDDKSILSQDTMPEPINRHHKRIPSRQKLSQEKKTENDSPLLTHEKTEQEQAYRQRFVKDLSRDTHPHDHSHAPTLPLPLERMSSPSILDLTDRKEKKAPQRATSHDADDMGGDSAHPTMPEETPAMPQPQPLVPVAVRPQEPHPIPFYTGRKTQPEHTDPTPHTHPSPEQASQQDSAQQDSTCDDFPPFLQKHHSR